MPDPFFEEIDRHQENLQADAERQAELVKSMMMTDGWEIVERYFQEELKAQQKTLLEIPVVPENLGALALAQANAKACQMLIDTVNGMSKLATRDE